MKRLVETFYKILPTGISPLYRRTKERAEQLAERLKDRDIDLRDAYRDLRETTEQSLDRLARLENANERITSLEREAESLARKYRLSQSRLEKTESDLQELRKTYSQLVADTDELTQQAIKNAQEARRVNELAELLTKQRTILRKRVEKLVRKVYQKQMPANQRIIGLAEEYQTSLRESSMRILEGLFSGKVTTEILQKAQEAGINVGDLTQASTNLGRIRELERTLEGYYAHSIKRLLVPSLDAISHASGIPFCLIQDRYGTQQIVTSSEVFRKRYLHYAPALVQSITSEQSQQTLKEGNLVSGTLRSQNGDIRYVAFAYSPPDGKPINPALGTIVYLHSEKIKFAERARRIINSMRKKPKP